MRGDNSILPASAPIRGTAEFLHPRAPIVSGVAALLFSRYADATAAQVKQTIAVSCTHVPELSAPSTAAGGRTPQDRPPDSRLSAEAGVDDQAQRDRVRCSGVMRAGHAA